VDFGEFLGVVMMRCKGWPYTPTPVRWGIMMMYRFKSPMGQSDCHFTIKNGSGHQSTHQALAAVGENPCQVIQDGGGGSSLPSVVKRASQSLQRRLVVPWLLMVAPG